MSGKLVIKNKKGTHVLPLEEIVYMEKDLRKIRVHTKDGEVEFYGRFQDISEALDDRFLCCHRSYILNMDQIFVMAEGQICFDKGKHLHYGRSTYHQAKRQFDAYLAQKRKQI